MFRNANQMVVKVRHPWRKWLVAALVVVGVPLGGWSLFDYGRSRAGFDSAAAAKQQAELKEVVANLQVANESFRQEAVTKEQSKDIDRQAYAEISQNLVSLQEEILGLKEEVAFYRGIVAPENSSAGVRVQSLRVAANGQPRGFTYKLVLTQMDKDSKPAKGSVNILLQGIKDKAPAEFAVDQLAGKDNAAYRFQFKYFDKSEGDIILPEAFMPTRVVVEVTTESPKRTRVESVYSWQEVTL